LEKIEEIERLKNSDELDRDKKLYRVFDLIVAIWIRSKSARI